MRGSRLVIIAGALLALASCGSDASESSATGAPVTEAPATDVPATDPPATEAPATDPPVTDAPVTDPPVTDPPATAPPTTLAPTTLAPTTTMPPAVIVLGEPDAEGVIPVTINGDLLDPLFDQFEDGVDPFYLVHTQQDDLFVGVELYTVFGNGWTGEIGTFPTDCTTHGICLYFDPDGTGPLEGGGPGTGTITITQLEGSTILMIDDLLIDTGEGTTYRLSGVTLTG